MALQMTYFLEGVDGIEITNAYIRIDKFAIAYDPTLAGLLASQGKGTGNKWVVKNIALAVKKAKNKNTLTLFGGGYDIAFDHTINASAVKQAYDYLKTLPEFSTSSDVLD